MKPNPTAAILVIGNEILSGRTQDTNVRFIAQHLAELGIDLMEVRIVPDDEWRIVRNVNTLRSRYTYLFTTGGIGATHDDITMGCIAKAFAVPLEKNEEANQILEAYYGKERYNTARQRMALMPVGATLIENPIWKAPSCSVENVFVLAGMPSVMKGMFESILPSLEKGQKIESRSASCLLQENVIALDLEEIQMQFPNVSIGSYPFYEDQNRCGTELVARSRDIDALQQAFDAILNMITRFGGTPEIV